MPDWTPEEPCELHFFVKKSSSSTQMRIYGPSDEQVFVNTGAANRRVDFYYRPGVGWISVAFTFGVIFGPNYTLPADTTFLPTTNNPVAP